MKKGFSIITALLISGVLFAAPVLMITGCSHENKDKPGTAEQDDDAELPSEDSYDTTEAGDGIGIESVDPDSGLTDGTLYTFTVTARYVLQSVDNAELNIGFNTDNAYSYSLIPDAAFPVTKGSGEHTFTVSARAKDWGAGSSFAVYVNLARNLDPDPPVVLVDVTMALGVE